MKTIEKFALISALTFSLAACNWFSSKDNQTADGTDTTITGNDLAVTTTDGTSIESDTIATETTTVSGM